MLLEGKKGLILGVANKRSIAWGIARAAAQQGAQLALSYQGERLQRTVEGLAEQLDQPLLVQADASSDEQLDACFARIGEEFGHLDFVVHAIAYANKEDLAGDYHLTSRRGFSEALDISAYSFTAAGSRALPLMAGRGGSLLTLSYLGGQRVVPGYNVMGVAKAALESSVRYLASDLGPHGVRVNALSAGPIRTLAASGVANFPAMLEVFKDRTPLRRNVTIDEVGDAALFFLSDLSRSVTGEVMHVDCGFHALAM